MTLAFTFSYNVLSCIFLFQISESEYEVKSQSANQQLVYQVNIDLSDSSMSITHVA